MIKHTQNNPEQPNDPHSNSATVTSTMLAYFADKKRILRESPGAKIADLRLAMHAQGLLSKLRGLATQGKARAADIIQLPEVAPELASSALRPTMVYLVSDTASNEGSKGLPVNTKVHKFLIDKGISAPPTHDEYWHGTCALIALLKISSNYFTVGSVGDSVQVHTPIQSALEAIRNSIYSKHPKAPLLLYVLGNETPPEHRSEVKQFLLGIAQWQKGISNDCKQSVFQALELISKSELNEWDKLRQPSKDSLNPPHQFLMLLTEAIRRERDPDMVYSIASSIRQVAVRSMRELLNDAHGLNRNNPFIQDETYFNYSRAIAEAIKHVVTLQSQTLGEDRFERALSELKVGGRCVSKIEKVMAISNLTDLLRYFLTTERHTKFTDNIFRMYKRFAQIQSSLREFFR